MFDSNERNHALFFIHFGLRGPKVVKEEEEQSASAVDSSERRTAANSAAARPVWPEQVEVEDREGQDTIEVAVVLELAPT